MVALTFTLLAAAPTFEVRGCGAGFDVAGLKRLVALDWPDPPDGTTVVIACESPTFGRLQLTAPGLLGTDEPLELPALPGPARTRVIALIVSERGRTFTNAPPAEPPPPELPLPPPPLPDPPVETVREPLVAKPVTAVAPLNPALASPPPGSSLRDGIFVFGTATEPSRRWRLAVAAAAVRPTWLQPWRFGPEVKVYGGPFVLALSTTVGMVNDPLASVTALALTAEPELTVACAGGERWRTCAAARGIVGYGSVFATSRVPDVIARRQDGVLLGGAGVVAASVALNGTFSIDADVRLGGAWGVLGSRDGVPLATVGGGLFAASLALAAAWGGP
ncbi:MAG: hypothetical protein JNK82_06125 [Myxococcaceae bacterium]|nr:hypothetical protein [Myxococcaceae bacterium]